MSDLTSNHDLETSHLLFRPGEAPQLEPPSRSDRTSESPTVEGPKGRWPVTRLLVLLGVALATALILRTGYAWGYYRLEHTVIKNASVKGRLYKIGARIDGQVKSVEVQPGQRVIRDQILVRLVDDHFQAAARQAQAELQSALKRWEVEKLAIAQERRRLGVAVARSESSSKAAAGDVEAAASTRDKWEREFARVTSLRNSEIASKSEVDTVIAERDRARAEFKVAQERQAVAESTCQETRLQLEGLHVREAGLEVLASDADLARARLALCEADLAAAVIRAPADGWVVAHIVEPGGSAKVGEPMMSLWLGTPWIEAWVDERKLARVKVGGLADVTLAAFPDQQLHGQIESIGVLADIEMQGLPVPSTLHSLFPDNAMIPVRIAVPEGQVRLQPGLSVIVGIHDPARDVFPKWWAAAIDFLQNQCAMASAFIESRCATTTAFIESL